MSRFVLYREVFFIRSVLYRRFHCIRMRNGGGVGQHAMYIHKGRVGRDILLIQLQLHISNSSTQPHRKQTMHL